MPKNYLKLASSVLDRGFIRRHTLKLHELEKSTSNSDFRQSTDYVCEFLREAGFEKIERYALPCDGVTTYDDCTMPLAWDRTGRSTLEILDKSLPKKQRLLADTDIEPINAVIWSVPTPPGGVTAELVDLHNAENGDWDGFRGKIVLCDRSPNGTMLRNLVKSGAIGTVSYIADILDTNPDDVRWMNGVGYCSWYYQKGDKTIWNFSITPRKGAWLADKLRGGEKITLKAVMNTRVYAGETYTVTAVIPGRSGKELALFAHMYEPFLADDSAGVVISAAIGKAIRELVAQRKLPALEHGIRVVFSMERYGFSEFFHQPKRVKRIIAGMNMDSVCHPTLKVAGIPLELRQSPSTAPFFGEIIIRDLLRKNFPNVKFRETPGNLSDDTFAAEPPFDIPTGWLHTPPAPNRHHNTGEVFGGIDWDIAETVFQVITAYYAQIATVRPDKAEFRDLFKRISQAVAKDATDDLNRLQEEYDNGTLNIYAVNIISTYLFDYHVSRIQAIHRLDVDGLFEKRIKCINAEDATWQDIIYLDTQMNFLKLTCNLFVRVKEFHDAFSSPSATYHLTNDEARLANMVVARNPKIRQIMSLSRLPESKRYSLPRKPEMLLQALLDGKRNLYEAFVISNFMLKRTPAPQEAKELATFVNALAPYGYYTVKKPAPLTTQELEKALVKLGLQPTDKVVVHSSYSSLGGVEGGPAAVVQTLIDYFGKTGLLMMPTFTLPFYHSKTDDKFFDVQKTPSCVGIISEEFRKHPGVYRSLNPSHSVAVYGKKNLKWIEGHHRTLTLGSESPLGKLEQADGYALMINCPGAVSFMHVVETTNRVPCLGYRTEEFQVKLPDGRQVPVRTWSWRGGLCIGYNEKAIYDYLRQHKLIREIMVRHSLWQCFKLSDYRKAYEHVVIHGTPGCPQCTILPRHAKNSVPSDWDDDKQCVRPDSPAFTGKWQE